ncbi:MAG: transcriptional regulator [Gemmataceae bacterium]|nr:transcriptional regulator [Gemmataceae bacterium]
MARAKATPDARERLVETADRLFYADGIRAVGIDRVIAEAGVAKATLYAHFPSKDDLILAVLRHREEVVTAFFAEATARHRKRLKDPLRGFFAALKEWFQSPGFRGCAFQNAAVELADPDHPGTVFVRGLKKRFHEWLAGLVGEAIGPAGETIAPAVAVLVEGAIVTALIDRSPASADVARDAALRLAARAGE